MLENMPAGESAFRRKTFISYANSYAHDSDNDELNGYGDEEGEGDEEDE